VGPTTFVNRRAFVTMNVLGAPALRGAGKVGALGCDRSPVPAAAREGGWERRQVSTAPQAPS
jgi:hypothetical protein